MSLCLTNTPKQLLRHNAKPMEDEEMVVAKTTKETRALTSRRQEWNQSHGGSPDVPCWNLQEGNE